MAGLLKDYIGLDIKDIADMYVGINKAKLDIGLQAQQNTINELVAQAELTRQQAKLAESLTLDPQSKPTSAAGFDTSRLMGWALLAGGAFLIYKLVK
jgi:hypothetical protein